MIITMNDTMRNLILPLEFGLEIYSDYEQVFVGHCGKKDIGIGKIIKSYRESRISL